MTDTIAWAAHLAHDREIVRAKELGALICDGHVYLTDAQMAVIILEKDGMVAAIAFLKEIVARRTVSPPSESVGKWILDIHNGYLKIHSDEDPRVFEFGCNWTVYVDGMFARIEKFKTMRSSGKV